MKMNKIEFRKALITELKKRNLEALMFKRYLEQEEIDILIEAGDIVLKEKSSPSIFELLEEMKAEHSKFADAMTKELISLGYHNLVEHIYTPLYKLAEFEISILLNVGRSVKKKIFSNDFT